MPNHALAWWMGWDLHEKPRHHAVLGSVSFALYMVSPHWKAYSLAQPGSLCVVRTSASCDLKPGDCVHLALSPSSSILPASRTPEGACHPDMSAGVFQMTGSITTHAQHAMHPYLGEKGLFSVWTMSRKRKHFMLLIRTEFGLLVLKQTNVKRVKLKKHLFWRQISCKNEFALLSRSSYESPE